MKGARLQLGLAFVVFGIAAFLAFRIHVFFLEPKGVIVGFDERYLAPFGLRMLDGGSLPYVDAVSHRGPLLYWMVELFQRIVGPFEWAALRWLSLVATVLTMAACFTVGLVARKPIAGAIGALLFGYVTTCVLEPGAGLGVNGELVAGPFAVGALALVAWGIERSGPRTSLLWLALGGFAAGCAGLAKQTSLAMIAPLAIWVGLASSGRERSIARALSALIGGWLLPMGATLVVYAARGHLSTFWYWYASYNARIYMEPYPRSSDARIIFDYLNEYPFLVLAILFPMAMGIIRPLAALGSLSFKDLVRSGSREGLEATVAWLAAFAMLAACLPLRFWPHYFVTAIPFLGLLAGLLIERFLGRSSHSSQLVAQALVVLGLLGWTGFGHAQRLESLNEQRRTKGHYIDKRSNAVCSAVEAHAKPHDRIFIWGFDGDFYIDCRRRPASRFVFTTFVAGVVPPFWKEAKPTRIVPGAPELLEADLRATKPPLILDFDTLGDRMSMREVPQLARLLDEDYCRLPDARARGATAGVWVRKEGGRCEDLGR